MQRAGGTPEISGQRSPAAPTPPGRRARARGKGAFRARFGTEQWVRRQQRCGRPGLNSQQRFPLLPQLDCATGAPGGAARSTALPAALFAFPIPLSDMEIRVLCLAQGVLQRDATLDHKATKRRARPAPYKPEESRSAINELGPMKDPFPSIKRRDSSYLECVALHRFTSNSFF